jgi:hypothetical protein
MPRVQRELANGRGRPRDRLPLPAEGRLQPQTQRPKTTWPPVPDLFDVITYFRARGDSFTLIASIGFWVGDDPKKRSLRKV